MSISLMHRYLVFRSEAMCTSTSPAREACAVSLHGALPISSRSPMSRRWRKSTPEASSTRGASVSIGTPSSEEHTSELQSRGHLVCSLLHEKKKPRRTNPTTPPGRRRQERRCQDTQEADDRR